MTTIVIEIDGRKTTIVDESNDLTIPEMIELFEGALIASGYGFIEGETLGIVSGPVDDRRRPM